MLGQRIITAVGLVAVLALVLVVLPRDLAVLALGILVLIGAWEWARLAGFRSVAGARRLRRRLRRGDGGAVVRRRRRRPTSSA